MRIHGLQKMTLLDFPGRVACTVFLGGCDFRCPFCHNFELADGSAKSVMEEDELLAFLQKRRGLLEGVAITGGEPCLHPGLKALMGKLKALGYAVKLDTNGMHPDRLAAILGEGLADYVAITGGEPCLHPDLPDLMRRIRGLGFAVKLDTNGTHPALLDGILREGLADYVAMDIKNSPEKYARTAGVGALDLDPVRRSVALLMNGNADYEFRTTVVEELHEDADFEAIGAWIAGARRFFMQPFTDRDTVPFGGLHAPSREKMEAWLGIMRRYVPESRLRGAD